MGDLLQVGQRKCSDRPKNRSVGINCTPTLADRLAHQTRNRVPWLSGGRSFTTQTFLPGLGIELALRIIDRKSVV